MAELGQYYRANPDASGGTNVNENDMLFRYRTVEALLAAGIPIEKADMLRCLLERSGRASVNASHLRSYVPKVEANEVDLICQEMADMMVTFIFDGTTRIGELCSSTSSHALSRRTSRSCSAWLP